MTQMQTTWRDVDISAYVDGELDPAAQAAFEVALAQDHALRQKVDEMREVVTLVRAIPLREPPRNYLLTPSMVTEKSVTEKSVTEKSANEKPPRRVQRRSTPLIFMRLATSLAAVAFVVASGLTYVQHGIAPTMMSEAPQAAYEMPAAEAQRAVVVVEVTKEVEVMRASEPKEMPAEPASIEEEVQAKKVVESEGVVPAQSPVPVPPAAMPQPSAGGADETAAMNAQEQAIPQPEILALEAAPVAEEQVMDKAESAVEDSTGTLSGTEEGEWMAYDTAEPTTADQYGTVTVAPSRTAPWRLPAILGVGTLLLAGVTYWMSRRR
jgi:anti-sigma factor RsiW